MTKAIGFVSKIAGSIGWSHPRLRSRARGVAALLLGVLCIFAAATLAMAQGVLNSSQQYGLTPWAINNQRVATQFNYSIDSISAVGSPSTFTFPSTVCTAALPNARNGAANAFPVGGSVKIIDVVSANTETVNLSATPVTFAGGNCTINMSPANTHLSYRLRSGTCGLKEALLDLSGTGSVVVTQEFYDQLCLQSTITSLTGGTAGNFIIDVSNGRNDVYGWNGTAFKLIQTNSNSHFGFGNPDVVGTGTSPVTVTFQKAYTVAPVCVASDQSGTPAAIQVNPSTTQVVLTGTAGHTLAYSCFANPN
jgi:hypothetical protein